MALHKRVSNLEELTARLGHVWPDGATVEDLTDAQLLRICGLEGHDLSEELAKELRQIAAGGEVRSK